MKKQKQNNISYNEMQKNNKLETYKVNPKAKCRIHNLTQEPECYLCSLENNLNNELLKKDDLRGLD